MGIIFGKDKGLNHSLSLSILKPESSTPVCLVLEGFETHTVDGGKVALLPRVRILL